MRRTVFGLIVPAILAGLSTTSNAAEPLGKTEQRIIKELVPKFVENIGHLGRGEIEQAHKKFATFAFAKPKPGTKQAGPFGVRSQWKATFTPLANTRPEFENVELIGLERLSSQSFRISLIAHARYGPVLFQCRAFTYRRKLYAVSLHFETNWDRNEFRIASIKNKLSKKYAIRSPQTAAKKARDKK